MSFDRCHAWLNGHSCDASLNDFDTNPTESGSGEIDSGFERVPHCCFDTFDVEVSTLIVSSLYVPLETTLATGRRYYTIAVSDGESRRGDHGHDNY